MGIANRNSLTHTAVIAERLVVLIDYIRCDLHERTKADTESMLALASELSNQLFSELSEAGDKADEQID